MKSKKQKMVIRAYTTKMRGLSRPQKYDIAKRRHLFITNEWKLAPFAMQLARIWVAEQFYAWQSMMKYRHYQHKDWQSPQK